MSTTPIRNVSGEDLFVPWLDRVVPADEVASVPDEDVKAYLCQPDTWEAASPSSGKGKGNSKSTAKS